MLFMSVCNYTPENRNEVIKRRLEKGAMDPPGLKPVGEWSYAGGGKVFRLLETDDARKLLGAASAWADLLEIEVYPVIETEEALRMLRCRGRKACLFHIPGFGKRWIQFCRPTMRGIVCACGFSID